MDRNELLNLLKDQKSIPQGKVEELKELIKHHPYFQIPYFLLAKAYYQTNHPDKDLAIQKASSYALERKVLKKFITAPVIHEILHEDIEEADENIAVGVETDSSGEKTSAISEVENSLEENRLNEIQSLDSNPEGLSTTISEDNTTETLSEESISIADEESNAVSESTSGEVDQVGERQDDSLISPEITAENQWESIEETIEATTENTYQKEDLSEPASSNRDDYYTRESKTSEEEIKEEEKYAGVENPSEENFRKKEEASNNEWESLGQSIESTTNDYQSEEFSESSTLNQENHYTDVNQPLEEENKKEEYITDNNVTEDAIDNEENVTVNEWESLEKTVTNTSDSLEIPDSNIIHQEDYYTKDSTYSDQVIKEEDNQTDNGNLQEETLEREEAIIEQERIEIPQDYKEEEIIQTAGEEEKTMTNEEIPTDYKTVSTSETFSPLEKEQSEEIFNLDYLNKIEELGDRRPNYRRKIQDELIDRFIQSRPSLNRPSVNAPSTEQEDLAEKNLVEDSNLVSENLAIIMVKQGKVEKAIDIYKKLIWKYPQKKAYFANRIEELKK